MFKKIKMGTIRTKKIMIGVGITLILTGFILMWVLNTWYAPLLGGGFIGGGIGTLFKNLKKKKE